MSHRLFLLRHAKSDWESEAASDHERPLNARGQRSADLIGRFLATTRSTPDLVLCSTATRTRETLERLSLAGDLEIESRFEASIYGGSPQDLVDLCHGLPESLATTMIIGHQPTLGGLAGALIGGGRVRMPTAALCCLDLDGPWPSLGQGSCELRWLHEPKVLQRFEKS